MRKMFIKNLTVVLLCAMFGVILANVLITNKLAENYANREAHNTVSQVLSKIEANNTEIEETKKILEKDYLTRCKAFRYMTETNPLLLSDSEELKKAAELLSVDELHVINEEGFIINTTNSKYLGYDMKSADQSIEFMKLFLGLQTELVQDIMPTGYDGDEFQYTGVVTNDKKYVLQVGMKPERYLDVTEQSSLSGFISKTAIPNADNYVYIIDIETGKYLDHSDKSLIGSPISQDADALRFYEAFKNGGIYEFLSEKYYMYAEKTDDMIIGVSYDYKNVTSLMENARIVMIIGITVIFILLIVFISLLVNHRIVSPITDIIADMNEISAGNMDKNVKKQTLPELKMLSKGINDMKHALICDSNKISGIISAAEIPIAVYEINNNTGKCSITGNLRKLYGLTDSEAEELFSDEKNVTKFIENIISHIENGEENIYRVNDKNRWVKITEIRDNDNVFCIVTDATDFILEKKKIQSERDLDALTGICNRRSFEKTVSVLMKNRKHDTESAMLMIDLDDFKSINDSFGHAFGDAYLKFTASCLKAFSDSNVIVGRRSGDEFYMYFNGFGSRAEIDGIINSVYEYLNSNKIESPDGETAVKFSAGAAYLTDSEDDFDSILDKADEMLYKAKREQKGSFVSDN